MGFDASTALPPLVPGTDSVLLEAAVPVVRMLHWFRPVLPSALGPLLGFLLSDVVSSSFSWRAGSFDSTVVSGRALFFLPIVLTELLALLRALFRLGARRRITSVVGALEFGAPFSTSSALG